MSHRQPFLNIRTEGALLPSDILSRLMEGINLPGLKPEDYHLGAGEKLNEAISRSWTRLLSLWLSFRKAAAALPESDLGTTLTRERWLLQLFQELGYGRLIGATSFEIEGKTYPISHVWQGQHYQVAIHLVSFRADLDKRSEQRIQGASKASPHGMVQEFLNRSEPHLWAFVSNGFKLLILRDNASLTRQAFVEFDLEGIFESEAYADFRLLWLVCHQSRLEGTAKDRPETCWLEVWSKQAQTDGRRALDQLRIGVEKALESLGTGFISHKANQALCQRLISGELNKQDLYRQLLRLVYRLIFLFVAEDRDLLHYPGASDEARSRYARFYSGQRLRRMAERTRGSRHADLWVGLRLVFSRIGDDRGCPELGLPALGGFLFGPQAMPDLESAELSNEHLLLAIRNLGLVKDRSGWRLVDYRNLGSEELGSVYESLLELNPSMELDAGVFSLSAVAGNQRKTSGSYYTPDSLVQCLLDSALDPVVEQAVKGKTPAEAEKAILALKVCDPAVGSGHFLVGAAHRLAKHLAQIRAQMHGESEPSPLYYQAALRDVIGHCLYGVDINPMAAELCRVSLWLEAIEPGKPLSFLDHHIQVGNSLLGATPALLAKGIPDEAFTAIEGDDKEVCKRFKKINKEERAGFRRLFAATTEPWERLGDLAASMTRLDDAPDDSIEAVREKQRMYEAMVRSGGYLDGQFWADTWCAAFFWKKTREFNYPITEEVFRRIEHNPHSCDPWMKVEITRLSSQYKFFHWHLAFPDVFHLPMSDQIAEDPEAGWNGGFDLILGNPPWDTLSPDRREYFSQFQAGMRSLSPDEQDAAIANLLNEPAIALNWEKYQRDLFSFVNFLKNSGRFNLFAPGNLGKGDFNVYRMFTEVSLKSVRNGGFTALVLPGGIYGGPNASAIRQFIFDKCELINLWGLSNTKRGWFAQVDVSRFAAFASHRGGRTGNFMALFGLMEPADLSREPIVLDADYIRRTAPDTYAVPDVRSAADISVAAKMTGQYPTFGDVSAGPPIRHYQSELHMGNDRYLFTDAAAGLPLYEGRMIGAYDHRAKTYASGHGNSSMWVERPFGDPEKAIVPQWRVLPETLPNKIGDRWRRYRLCFRDVAQPRDIRSLIAALIPPGVVCGDKVPTLDFQWENEWAYLPWLAVANSFVMDWMVRSKLSSPKMSFTLMDSLPFPRPKLEDDWVQRVAPLVLRLICTAPEMTSYWNKMAEFGFCTAIEGESVPPDAFTHEGDRQSARAEIDAIVAAQVFGLTRAELSEILDTFPIVKSKDEEKWSEYRTKRVILEIYDAMAEAMRTGDPYQTRLSPPPADPSVAHPWPAEMPRQPQIVPNPLEDLNAVADAAWATPQGVSPENAAIFTVIEVMRLLNGAVDAERLRTAANLVRSPAIAAALMEDAEAAEWARVIGQEAQPLRSNVIQISQFQQGAQDLPWAEAVRQLQGSGAITVGSDGKWSAGSRLPATSKQDWIHGRAAVVVHLLSVIEPAAAEAKILAFIRSVEDGTARRAVS